MILQWNRIKEKRIMISTLLSAFITLCSLAEADTMKIVNSSGAPCDAGVVVPVLLTNSMAVAGINFRITFDESIVHPYIVYAADTRLDGLFEVFEYDLSEPGVVKFFGLSSYSDPEAYSLPAGSGLIANIFFSIDCFISPREVAIRFEEDPATPEPDNSLSDSRGVTFIIPTLIDGVLTIDYLYNHPPIINPIPGGKEQSVQEGETLAFEVSAYDPDGDTLEMWATGLPAHATFPFLWGEAAISGPFRFTPDFTQGGQVYDIFFTARDTSGLADNDTLKITVIDVPLEKPPAPPDSLRIVGGDIFVTLSWVNPTKYENGYEILDLDGIVIYRNGAIIDSVSTTIPGAEESYIDRNLVASEYMYWLMAFNDYGLSAPSDSVSIEVCGLKCDDNNDWWIDILDLIREINIILGIGESLDCCGFWRADCNGDGVLNVLDPLTKVNCILGIISCPPTGLVKITPAVIEYLHSLESHFPDEDFDTFMALVKNEVQVPAEYSLAQNYPNPFNHSTDIRYQIADSRYTIHTTLKIYNILGQEVKTLVDDDQEAGYYQAQWDASGLASGVYFYRLTAGTFTDTKRMVLMK